MIVGHFFISTGDEYGTDSWQTQADVILGAEDSSAQRADAQRGEPHEEQLPDTVSNEDTKSWHSPPE